MIKQALLYWLPMPLLGFANGIFRGMVLLNFFEELHARQISSVLMVIWIVLYVRLIFNRLKFFNAGDAWITGSLWLVLTMAFEFGLGLITGTSLQTMLDDYNIFAGKLWALVLMAVLLIPVAYYYTIKDSAYKRYQ